ncbi:MAG: T9SS type A sorting domain-containing protein [Fimbriimonadaceae bacterium]|nr:T9SS type A sorting domain-containing protein [Chitinophagales bacterium]
MKNINAKNNTGKLAGYSALAGAFLAVGSEAKGQVVYTDITDEAVEIGDLFFLDMNADAADDFLFQATSTSGGSWSFARVFGSITTSVYAFGNSSNEVIGYYGFLPYGSALNSGDAIGTGGDFISFYNVAFLASIYGGVTYGAFADQTDKYLGVKFIVGGNTHYGWIRMDGTVAPVSLTIKDYAYDATPDTEIAAGDMGGGGGLTCETPSVTVVNVLSTGAKLAWSTIDGASNYKVRYRVEGSDTWQKEHTAKTKIRLMGLDCSTTYEYQVAAVCSDGVEIGLSEYSEIATFTTGACRIGATDGEGDIGLSLSPNPAQSFVNIYADGFTAERVTVEIFNVIGERVASFEMNYDDNMQLNVSELQSGIYTVNISDGMQSVADKFVKQ